MSTTTIVLLMLVGGALLLTVVVLATRPAEKKSGLGDLAGLITTIAAL